MQLLLEDTSIDLNPMMKTAWEDVGEYVLGSSTTNGVRKMLKENISLHIGSNYCTEVSAMGKTTKCFHCMNKAVTNCPCRWKVMLQKYNDESFVATVLKSMEHDHENVQESTRKETRIKNDIRSFIQRNKFFPVTHLLEEVKKQRPLILNTFSSVQLKKKIKAIRDYEIKKSHQFDSISNMTMAEMKSYFEERTISINDYVISPGIRTGSNESCKCLMFVYFIHYDI